MRRALRTITDSLRKDPTVRSVARRAVWLIPDLPWTVRIPDVGPLRIRLRRNRYLFWEHPLVNDWLMMSAFERMIRPGDVVYDIGGAIGLYTRVLSHWFGPLRVVTIEPMSANVQQIRRNVALGGLLERVTVLHMAAADREGYEDLQIDDIMSGTAVLDRVTGGRASHGRQHLGLPPKVERVRVRTIDGIIADGTAPPPAFIKIDTEGAEGDVLRGARRTIDQHRPRLAIALHGDDKARDCAAVLAGHGYHVAGWVSTPGSPRVYAAITPDNVGALADNNIIASADPADVATEPPRLTSAPRRGPRPPGS
ncbi:MAG: hypothetical protein C0513_02845 [Isosphaera sp.]|nr:hypothetical protein [Isosphaera sp.]